MCEGFLNPGQLYNSYSLRLPNRPPKKQLDTDQERKEAKPVVEDEVGDGGQLPRLIAEMIYN